MQCLRQSLLKNESLSNMNTMVIITFIEDISILLVFIFTVPNPPPPQNLISATDIKFTIGGAPCLE